MSYKTTIVSCLFDCHADTTFNAKNYYKRKSVRTLTIEQPMIIFCDDANFDYLYNIRKIFGLESLTTVIPMKISDFFFSQYREDMKKIYRHSKDPKSDTPDLFILWLSKTEMIQKASHLNPYKSTHFMWMDINLLNKTYNNSINFIHEDIYTKIDTICKYPKDKMSIQILNVWLPESYENLSFFFSEYRWIVCACFFTIDLETVDFIAEKVKEEGLDKLKQGYCQGDEANYAFIIDKYPEKFTFSIGDYQDVINNYYKVCSNIPYVNKVLNLFKFNREEIFNKIISDYLSNGDKYKL